MIDEELFQEVLAEHRRQLDKYPQNYAYGTGKKTELLSMCSRLRELASIKTDMGTVTWAEVLTEETLEAITEEDPAKLKRELIQVATVALAWASKIPKGRGSNFHTPTREEIEEHRRLMRTIEGGE